MAGLCDCICVRFLSAILLSGDSILARSDIGSIVVSRGCSESGCAEGIVALSGDLRSMPFWLCAIEFRK